METALAQFENNGATEGLSPLERLRFFCSLAMSGQDWLDVEPFFAALEADSKDAERYRWLRRFTGAGRTTRGLQQFVLSPPQPGERDLFRGSVAQHLDSAIDAAIASETQNVRAKRGGTVLRDDSA